MHNSAGRIQENNRNAIPCLGLSCIISLILGMLPIVPSQITQVLRPAEILLCFAFPASFIYRLSTSSKWMLTFMAYYALVFACHPITQSTFMAWASLELFSAFYILMISRPWNKKNIRAFLMVSAFASTVFAAIIYRDNPNFLHEKSYSGTVFLSSTVNDNTAAFGIVPGALCSIVMFFFHSHHNRSVINWKKLFFLACYGICLFILFCLGARSAFFSALAGSALIALEWSNQRKTRGGRAMARIILILLLFAVFVVGTTVTVGTHSARLFDMDNMTDGTGREVLAEQAWEMIHKKPIFGGGFDYWVDENGDPLGTHNSFLTHMVQGGYISLVILIGFLVSSVYELWRSRSLIPLAFVAEMIAHTFTESDLNYYAYIPLIISFSLVKYASYHRCRVVDIFSDNKR